MDKSGDLWNATGTTVKTFWKFSYEISSYRENKTGWATVLVSSGTGIYR
jgi:hypothetical protein